MTRILNIFLLLTLGSTLSSYGQKNLKKIQGLWECYSSINDTINPASVQVWYLFGKSTVAALMAPSYKFPGGTGMTEKYILKNDTLKTFHKNETTTTVVVSVINNNLITYLLPGEKENERVYLKRVKK